MADDEVVQIRRETRRLSVDRRSMQNDSNAIIRKQDAMLAVLRKDNDTLKTDLNVAEQEQGAVMKSKDAITNKQLQYDGYASEIKNEQARVTELDKEANKLRKALQKARERKAKAQRESKDKSAADRQIGRLENRVQKATNDYDDQLAVNAKLRHTIDHLKKERLTFHGLRDKLGSNIKAQQVTLAELTDRSNQAHEARNEALLKIAALKEKTEKEQAQSSVELKELTRVLEHERSLKEFMGQKGRSRQAELAEAEKDRKKLLDAAVKPEQLIEEYDSVFSTIKEITGISDNNQLVDTFIETEVRNFALFKLVSEINNDIEACKEQIHETELKTAQLKRESEMTGGDRRKLLQDLEAQLAASEEKRDQLSTQATQSMEQVATLKEAVAETFTSIGCDDSAFSKMLGEKEVADSNIISYLGLIEQRATELLQKLTVINAKATEKWEADAHRLILENATLGADGIKDFDPATQLAEKPPAPKGLLGAGPKTESLGVIEPPSVVDDDDDDDEESEDVRPLSLDEMRNKVRGKVV